MKLLLVAAIMLMLSSVALAAQESQQLGPYAATFNMNTDQSYQLLVADPIQTQTATIYSMKIFTDNATLATISIMNYNSVMDSTLDMYKQIFAMKMATVNGFNTTSVEDRTIDGKEAFLLVCEPFSSNTAAPAGAVLYNALYWLDSQDCECGPVSVGKTSVEITSSYSQDVTESMLSSLHVVEGVVPSTTASSTAASSTASSSTSSGQVLPPE